MNPNHTDVIELLQHVCGSWMARADFTNGEWTATPFFGTTSFKYVAGVLKNLNPGYDVIEVK
jgi:hypothetical protein